ncbi:eukaryotic translation initiation factor-like protein subunit eIF2B-gamma [Lophium mytilinum]|uniref:Translation initiation factor eIF2B subunit gamma n=1 Tax=Lophium mytilinum TaxID=390894 RepID=A0A6A6QVR7_9PEZI|nr:eukaryotic translation initiation factor-like protein subunit eIF2B-gamma [Lophium mytilinum]
MSTFTSSPADIPKALLPIANRPMVWYPLEWCYRMGVTDITLITPAESKDAIEAALSQNPHLTSLPAPRPDLKAPKGLTHQTGTGEIFRLEEVQRIITGDFIVLPCDLVCELGGASLAEAWMVEQGGLGGATGGIFDGIKAPIGLGGEKIGRRGGLGVWYETKTEDGVKGEETDLIALTPLSPPIVPPPRDSLRRDISNLVYTVPTDTLNDIVEVRKCLPVRHQLLKKHGRIKMLTTHRDAHVYFFPYWVLEMMKRNEKFESISEEVLGWWAKAGWQEGLGDKLGLRDIFQNGSASDSPVDRSFGLDEEINVAKLSSTWVDPNPSADGGKAPLSFASRVRDPDSPQAPLSTLNQKLPLPVPPILAYIQPSAPTNPLIRRVDSVQLLLNVSLRLAKLPSIEEIGVEKASPFAHKFKIAHKKSIPKRCSVQAENSLLAENVTVEEKCNIKESVIGFNCKIGEGARLLRCLIMDGAEVGANAQLSDCVLGRRCRIEGGPAKGDDKTVLKKCEVQEGHVVKWGTAASDEKFMRFDLPSDDDMEDTGFTNDGLEASEPEGISLR